MMMIMMITIDLTNFTMSCWCLQVYQLILLFKTVLRVEMCRLWWSRWQLWRYDNNDDGGGGGDDEEDDDDDDDDDYDDYDDDNDDNENDDMRYCFTLFNWNINVFC